MIILSDMKFIAKLQGKSEHFSSPNSISLSFGAEDGTTANMTVGIIAKDMVMTGKDYVITVSEYGPETVSPQVVPAPEVLQPEQGV